MDRNDCPACSAGYPRHLQIRHGGRNLRSDRPEPGARKAENLSPEFQALVEQAIDLTMEDHIRNGCRGKCAYCECRHEGRTPGFAAGECDCARIGGSWIQPNPHAYVPTDEHQDCAPEKRALLVGDWALDSSGHYAVDQGAAGFAATLIDGMVMVMHSKTHSQGALEAPWVDLERTGQWLGFDLPERLRKNS